MADSDTRATSGMPTSGQRDKPERHSHSKSLSDQATQGSRHPLSSIRNPIDSLPSQAMNDRTSPSRAGAKVAIPRLRRDDDILSPTPSTSTENKHRVSHACEPCRQRKTKCSGERPTCKHCEDFKITCIYADGKRDRTKREYNTMAAQVAEYQKVLVDLRDRVDRADQLLIQRTLQKVGSFDLRGKLPLIVKGIQDITAESEVSFNQSISSQNLLLDKVGSGKFNNEHQATGSAGSTDSVDCIDENFNRSDAARSTGFLGKISEVTWMGKLIKRTSAEGYDDNNNTIPQMNFGFGLDPMDDDEAEKAKKNRLLSDSNYHCDDVPFLVLDNVQAYQVPPRATADSLLTCYLESVHPAFPILGKITFLKQYQAFYSNPNLNTGSKWLSVLNLIFALGARYSGLVGMEGEGVADEPDVYFSRAWLLGLDGDSLWTPAELQRIQIAGLASFYLMATHQINR
ncbi:MAG: hypothetical protein Q9216_005477 [Gyalolechia sp. 2 TL-2023]